MLSLSATLTAEQRKPSYVPYNRVYLPNYSGGTDLTDYVREGFHTELVFGGGSSILLGDLESWFFSSGTPIDLKGQQVDIGPGFVTYSGKEYKNRGPVWVKNIRIISYQGVLHVVLECFDTWEKLGMINVCGDEGSDPPSWNADTTIYDIIDAKLTDVGITLTKDSSDGIVDVWKPVYQASYNQSIRSLIIDLIGLTDCYIRMRAASMHIGKLAEDDSSSDYYLYELGGDHTFKSSLEDDEVTIPNRIRVLSDFDERTYLGEAEDTNSTAALGFDVTREYVIYGLASDAQAIQFAEAILLSIQRGVSRGIVRVPLNCGQELFDYVVVTDNRWPS